MSDFLNEKAKEEVENEEISELEEADDVEVKDEEKEPGIFEKLHRKIFGNSGAKRSARIVAFLLAMLMLFTAGCGNNSKPSGSETTSSKIEIDPSKEDEPEGVKPLEIPSRLEKIAEAFNKNNDVVGWLHIPGLEDVDSGVCQDKKSYSYNYKDVTGKKVSEYWVTGAYYTHLRNTFGKSVDDLSTNTVIFGHSDLGKTHLLYANDDPTGPRFSQLFSFKDPNFAEKTPYIFFSTADGDHVWEVFSVFYNDSKLDGGKSLWYIEPEPGADYQTLIDTVRSRSLYNYDVEVTTDDKILTLSTCTVGYGLNVRKRYRFVVVAKLLDSEAEILDRNAKIEINEFAPVPDTYAKEFESYLTNWKPGAADTETSESSAPETSGGITITPSTETSTGITITPASGENTSGTGAETAGSSGSSSAAA